MLHCENCNFEINESAEFCPSCGSLFEEKKCSNHDNRDSEGTCVICSQSACENCGQTVNNKFLCNEHSDLEIYESMVRVFGSSDSLQLDYLISMLEQEGLHPFRFDRKTNPISLGGIDYSLFRAAGDYEGHILNEIKIMVPLNEYLEALKLVEDIKSV